MMYTLIAFFTLSMFIHEGYLLEIRRDATGDVYNNNKCDQGTIIGNRDHTLQCVTNREDTGKITFICNYLIQFNLCPYTKKIQNNFISN